MSDASITWHWGCYASYFCHTWATRAAEDGVPMKTIADFMGDTEETVKKNYLHLSPDYLKEAINRRR